IIALLLVVLSFVLLFTDIFYIYRVGVDTLNFSYFNDAFAANEVYNGTTFSVFLFSYINVLAYLTLGLSIVLISLKIFERFDYIKILTKSMYFSLFLSLIIIFFSRVTLVFPDGEEMRLDVGSSFWSLFIFMLGAIFIIR